LATIILFSARSCCLKLHETVPNHILYSKIAKEEFKDAINYILENKKERKFTETIELQIGLKDYDPKKDKRFSGTIRLGYLCKTTMKTCVIGDVQHMEEAKLLGIDCIDLDGLKKFNKDKKLIKKWAKKYHLLLATDVLSRKIPRVLGPTLTKIGMYPQVISHGQPLKDKMDEIKSSVKFQLKKVLCLGVAVGNEKLTKEQIEENMVTSINFLVSLLKKGWNNIKSLTIKTTMGKPYKIWG
jgi:large subunit ribosomal protein L10Ae